MAILLAGVISASLAGFGRDRALKKLEKTSGGFLGGLIMTVVAGLLSSCINFTFVYSQGPIVAHFSQVEPNQRITVAIADQSLEYTVSNEGTVDIEKLGPVAIAGQSAADAAEQIAEQHPIDPAKRPPRGPRRDGQHPRELRSLGPGPGGRRAVNVGYAVHLLNRNKSWHVLTHSAGEFALAVVIGINFSIAVTLMGKGMLLLGGLGSLGRLRHPAVHADDRRPRAGLRQRRMARRPRKASLPDVRGHRDSARRRRGTGFQQHAGQVVLMQARGRGGPVPACAFLPQKTHVGTTRNLHFTHDFRSGGWPSDNTHVLNGRAQYS